MRYLGLADAKPYIHDGDLLLFRRRGLVAAAGRSIYSHAAKAAWWNGTVFCLEVREWHGGQAVTLASQVKQWPGRIDLYEANAGDRWPEYSRKKVVETMQEFCGCEYGYLGVMKAGLLHLPVVRLFVRASMEDRAIATRSPFCSQACAIADRSGGVDPVPRLADRITEPADLARSLFYAYCCTLLFEKE